MLWIDPTSATPPETWLDVKKNGWLMLRGLESVTSSYYSPTLKRGIAMGLVLHGPDRMGEEVSIPKLDGSEVKARIVETCFYDKEGAKQDV